MNEPPIEKNSKAQESLNQFMKQLGFGIRRTEPVKPVFEVVSSIFSNAGHAQLLQLTRLRQLWFQRMDPFLAQHAYPQSFSIIRQFKVDESFLRGTSLSAMSAQWKTKLQLLEGQIFENLRSFWKALTKGSRTVPSAEEKQEWNQLIGWSYHGWTLHLRVYDGGLAQAIHLEKARYLEQIKELLPSINMTRIQCHVGEIEPLLKEFQQSFVSSTKGVLSPPSDSQKNLNPEVSAEETIQTIIQRMKDQTVR